jgi:hypothetical protein
MVTIEHARMAGYCSKGMRIFAERHNFPWSKFLKEGVDSKILLSTKDEMAIQMVEKAKEHGQK